MKLDWKQSVSNSYCIRVVLLYVFSLVLVF